jgi:hypothetical protein
MLRLCKRTRRQVWDFFRSPDHYQWIMFSDFLYAIGRFCVNYTNDGGREFFNMTPCFVPFTLDDSPLIYRPARALVMMDTPDGKTPVIWPTLYYLDEDDDSDDIKNYFVHYDTGLVDTRVIQLHWCLVADALGIAADTLFLNKTDEIGTRRDFRWTIAIY